MPNGKKLRNLLKFHNLELSACADNDSITALLLKVILGPSGSEAGKALQSRTSRKRLHRWGRYKVDLCNPVPLKKLSATVTSLSGQVCALFFIKSSFTSSQNLEAPKAKIRSWLVLIKMTPRSLIMVIRSYPRLQLCNRVIWNGPWSFGGARAQTLYMRA